MSHTRYISFLLAVLISLHCATASLAAQLPPELLADAVRNAAAEVQDSVVQLQPIGGVDPLSAADAGGPTTGVLITAEGLILTSSFGLDPEPASILVRYADGTRTSGKLLAIDHNRGLALIQARPPESAPAKIIPAENVRLGETAIAIGRTYDSQRPNLSVGIVSAKGRLFGRAIQTDAAISPANYGGPLINLYGQVIGILTPLGPENQGQMTGISWYDSGIGFAVPLQDALDRIETLRSGKAIQRGLAGIAIPAKDTYRTPAKLITVHPGGPAQRAGLQVGDVIVAADGKEIGSAMDYRLATGSKDAGTQLSLRILRDGKPVTATVTLTSELAPYRHAQIGVILNRQQDASDTQSLSIATVLPNTPAAELGLKSGDAIVSIAGNKVASREEAIEQLAGVLVGDQIDLVTTRGGKETTHQIKLTPLQHTPLPANLLPSLPEEEPTEETVPLPGSKREILLTIPAIPKGESSQQQPRPLLVWLGGSTGEKPLAEQLRGYVIAELLSDKTQPAVPLDRPTIAELLDLVTARKSVDQNRIAIAASGKQSRVATAAGISFRERISGVILVSPTGRTPRIKQNSPTARLAAHITGSKRSAKSFAKSFDKAGYPTYESPTEGMEQLPAWLEGLDRL